MHGSVKTYQDHTRTHTHLDTHRASYLLESAQSDVGNTDFCSRDASAAPAQSEQKQTRRRKTSGSQMFSAKFRGQRGQTPANSQFNPSVAD